MSGWYKLTVSIRPSSVSEYQAFPSNQSIRVFIFPLSPQLIHVNCTKLYRGFSHYPRVKAAVFWSGAAFIRGRGLLVIGVIVSPWGFETKKIVEYIPCLGTPSIFFILFRTKDKMQSYWPAIPSWQTHTKLYTLSWPCLGHWEVKNFILPTWDQNLQFIPVKTISLPVTFIWEFPPQSRWFIAILLVLTCC